MKTNLTIISSDEFEGREITSRGAKKAADYLAAKLKEYGVQPFGDSGTYFQEFPVYVSGYDYKAAVTISDDTRSSALELNNDFILHSAKHLPLNFTCDEKELVFVNYGIIAKEYDYDDYKNLDVKGKVIVLLSGEPKSDDEEYFDGNYETVYSEIKNKLRTAEDHGAVGALLLPDTEVLYYYDYLRKRGNMKEFSLEYEDQEELREEETIPALTLNRKGADKLLGYSDIDYNYFYNGYISKLAGNIFQGISISIAYEIKSVNEKRTARNVVGIIPGNDDALKTQLVTLGAHYDHDGILGGVIYNGADDNGSGTVAILELARLLSKLELKRSVVCVFHTGEERGLLGSKYLTENSDFIKDIYCNINIDMVGRGPDNMIYSIGSDRLTDSYKEIIEDVNSQTVNVTLDYSFDGLNDPNRYYYRSDHYNYAKKGIPIVFLYDHMTIDYHKPTDDVDKIKFDKIAKITDLIYHLVLTLSDEENDLR